MARELTDEADLRPCLQQDPVRLRTARRLRAQLSRPSLERRRREILHARHLHRALQATHARASVVCALYAGDGQGLDAGRVGGGHDGRVDEYFAGDGSAVGIECVQRLLRESRIPESTGWSERGRPSPPRRRRLPRCCGCCHAAIEGGSALGSHDALPRLLAPIVRTLLLRAHSSSRLHGFLASTTHSSPRLAASTTLCSTHRVLSVCTCSLREDQPGEKNRLEHPTWLP